jgi:hypothetical protein
MMNGNGGVSRLAVFSWFAMSRRSSNITRLLDRGSFNDRVLRQLGGSMAFIAGALNAGGFWQYSVIPRMFPASCPAWPMIWRWEKSACRCPC